MHFATEHKATQIDAIAKRYGGFVPIANGDFGMLCELEVLFLRPEPPGKLWKKGSGGGDIDNRMKVLIDALSIPEPGVVVRNESEPNPIFVLLSDDSLITSLKITADTLLDPATNDKHEACVIIHANVKTFDPISAPYGISV